MKQSELDAAVKSARESVTRMMKAAGYGNYIADIEKHVDYVEVVQLALEDAEKARKQVERDDPDAVVSVSGATYNELRDALTSIDKLELRTPHQPSYMPDFMMGDFVIRFHNQPEAKS